MTINLVSIVTAALLVGGGTLQAYDVSNPAGLANAQPFAHAAPPIGYTMPDGTVVPGQTWAVATDQHGRVYATAMNALTLGILSSRQP